MSSLSPSLPFGLSRGYSFSNTIPQHATIGGLAVFTIQSQQDSSSLLPSSLDFRSPSSISQPMAEKPKTIFVAGISKTPEVAAVVYGDNIEGMKGVIFEKLAQVDTPLYQDDPIAQTRLLLDAYDTVGAFLAAVQKDAGDNPSPQLKSIIQQLETLQALVLQKFKSVLGVDLTQEELKALLDNNPKSEQNKDKTKLLGPQDPKTKALLGSASQKLTKQLDTITQQVSQLLSQAESNSAQAPMLIIQAMLLLRQGLQITMIAGALETMGNNVQAHTQGQQATTGSMNYSQVKQKLMILLGKAIQLSKANGIQAENLITSTELDGNAAA